MRGRTLQPCMPFTWRSSHHLVQVRTRSHAIQIAIKRPAKHSAPWIERNCVLKLRVPVILDQTSGTAFVLSRWSQSETQKKESGDANSPWMDLGSCRGGL